MAERVERRLTTILAADVAEYSRLMRADEDATLALLTRCRDLAAALIAEHRGRIANTAGDAVLAEFPSVADGLYCALTIQKAVGNENEALPSDRRMLFRIGLHVGDIMIREGDLFGDAVNVAARLQALAEPGGICVSAAVRACGQPCTCRLHGCRGAAGQEHRRTGACFPGGGKRHNAGHRRAGALAAPRQAVDRGIALRQYERRPGAGIFRRRLVEEIITALSRIRWLFVIARNSTFTYKGQTVDVKQVGRELGVRYVLEGSARKADSRVRITAQLIDALTGTHLWADRFDGSLEDVFELQDKVASSVAGAIEPALQAAEMRRSAMRPTTHLTAYDLYLRALAGFFPTTRERAIDALGLFEQAIAIDPCYGPALSWAAICHRVLAINAWTGTPETNRRKAGNLARQALEVAQNDPGVLANAAVVLAQFAEDIGVMMALVDRALALNPSFARGWYASGVLRGWAGQHDLSISHVETSLRLSPRERAGTPQSRMGEAYFFKHQFDGAVSKLLLFIQENPGAPVVYRFLAACYAHMGRLDEARAIIARLRAITTLVVPSDLPWRNPQDRELLLSGLRLAIGEAT